MLSVVPPSSIAISGIPNANAQVGSDITVNCTCLGGNPTPDVVWYRNQTEKDITSSQVGQLTFLNTYQFEVSSADKDIPLECRCFNSEGTLRETAYGRTLLAYFYNPSLSKRQNGLVEQGL